MIALFEASLRVPTVFFTIALGIVLLYWLFVLIGALDIDLFGGDASGAAKGLGEALAGGKSLGDALAGAKGMGEALGGAGGEAAGEAMAGAKGVGEAVKIETGHHDVGGGFWHALGLATVPVTISASVVVVVGWALSIMGMYYGAMLLGENSIVLAIAVAVSTVLVGIPLAGLLVRPLHPIFKLRTGKGNRDYVGALCTITTGQVNQAFGQATVEEGGTFLVIAVRCENPELLKRGDRALIIDFDPTRHAYVVEPALDTGLLT